MRRSRLTAAAAVVGVAGFTAAAVAGDQRARVRDRHDAGYEEVPAGVHDRQRPG